MRIRDYSYKRTNGRIVANIMTGPYFNFEACDSRLREEA